MFARSCITFAALSLSACGLLDGSSLPSAKPTQVAGGGVNCAVTEAGGVRCWGPSGEALGSSDHVDEWAVTPVEVAGLTGATSVAVGEAFACAIVDAGDVRCWGANGAGQLGSGVDVIDSTSLAPSTRPVAVANLTGVQQLALGDDFACARTQSGDVTCWGAGYDGQLGDGFDLMSGGASAHFSTRALAVSGLGSARSLSAHGEYACAVNAAHAVLCWGRGTSTPTVVPGFETGIDQVFVGASRGIGPLVVCAITSEGAAKCMSTSDEADAILGRGASTSTDTRTPMVVSGLTSGVTTMSVGSYVACAITGSALQCWGTNDFLGGEALGVGESPSFTSVPVAIPSLGNVTSVSVGFCTVCAVASDKAYCWGRHACVGDGFDDLSSSDSRYVPTAVTSLP